MAFFSWTKWLRHSKRTQNRTFRKARLNCLPLGAEMLEDRFAPAVLPAAVVSAPLPLDGANFSGISPSLAQDPTTPAKLIEVHTSNNGSGSVGAVIIGNYTTSSGADWSGFLNLTPINDLNTNAPYAQIDHATVTIDRAHNVYITAIHHTADNSSGALVFYRYTFSGAAPTLSAGPTVLQRWHGDDPIYNAVVAVDNNVDSFTDPVTGQVQTDSMASLASGFAKGLFVAWNTNDTTPNPGPTTQTFNPNVIRVMGSSDGGANFTSPQIVNDNGYFESLSSPNHYATPQIVFTQGTAGVANSGGQLVFVWHNFGTSEILLDASRPDNGSATNPAPASYSFTGDTGNIGEAIAHVNSASVSNGGNAVYNVGDILTVQGGTFTTAARLQLTAVSGGPPGTATGTVTVLTPGNYTILPTNPVSVDFGGATFNLDWGGCGIL